MFSVSIQEFVIALTHVTYCTCLVQLSYQIWPQKTTEGSPDCWANHWYNPPHSPTTVLTVSRVSKRAGKITLDPSHPTHSLFERLQEQFLSPSNPSHEHLTINMEHTTLLYIIYSSHIFIFFISILHISDLYTHNCLYYILCFCYFVHCLFVYYSFISVSCPVAVIQLHCGASVTITNSSYV